MFTGPDLRHHAIRLKGTTKLVQSGHRRPPHGTGMVYVEALLDEAQAWCLERNMPIPVVGIDPDNPGGYVVIFKDKDHAFEFKLRWYGNE